MNRKPILYSLAGLLTGSAATALLTIAITKATPQASTPTFPIGNTNPAHAQTATLVQATSPGNTTPVPFRRGMMGQSDDHFIVMMIPHHEGAVAMAELALSRAKHPEIKQLAEAIKKTQTQEIQQMRTWYKQWYGTDVPVWGPGRGWGWDNRDRQWQGNNPRPGWGSGMGMHRSRQWQGNNTQPGWGSGMGCCMGRGSMGTNLYALQNAPDFDREFIQQMIPHHQMAVMMGSMVLNSSQHPEIRNLAQSIIKGQNAEIDQMQQWYQTWYQ